MVFGVAAAAAFVSYVIKGLTGFGNTLIFSSILSFFANTVSITPVESVLSLPSSAFIAWRNRREFRWKLILPVSGVMTLGTLAGVLLLKGSSPKALKIAFGFIVIALAVEMILRERAKKRDGNKAALLAIGVLAGVMSGLYGVGALMAAYMSRTTDTGAGFRGNLCAVFFLSDIVRLGLYIASGVLTAEILLTVLKLAPFMIAGLALGTALTGKLPEKAVKNAVVALLLISGISLVLTKLL